MSQFLHSRIIIDLTSEEKVLMVSRFWTIEYMHTCLVRKEFYEDC